MSAIACAILAHAFLADRQDESVATFIIRHVVAFAYIVMTMYYLS